MMDNNITIADVAKTAGVSVSTVSRVLNNRPDVSSNTRDHVLKVINEMGYAPMTQARSLRQPNNRARTIALTHPADHLSLSKLSLDFFIGASQAAGEAGFLFNLLTTPLDDSELLGLYRRAEVDGMILMQVHVDDWRVNLLQENAYPFVMIGHTDQYAGLSFVNLDIRAAIRLAVEHLVSLGHQHIGFIGLPEAMRLAGHGPSVRAMLGYQDGCGAAGLPMYIRETDQTISDAYAAMESLLREQPALSAVVNMDGPTATGTIRALNDAGLRVPDDFSVIALSTDEMAELVTPPLTSIHFPTYDMGYQAAAILVRKLNSEQPITEQAMLPPRLILRQSTAQI